MPDIGDITSSVLVEWKDGKGVYVAETNWIDFGVYKQTVEDIMPSYDRICPTCAPQVKCDKKGKAPTMDFSAMNQEWRCLVCRQSWTEDFLEEMAPATKLEKEESTDNRRG